MKYNTTLDWAEIPNAKWYLLEVSTTNNFANPQSFVVDSTSYAYAISEFEKNYFWRVTVYSELPNCREFFVSTTWAFAIGTLATTPIPNNQQWTISLNPVRSSIHLQAKVKHAFEAQASIVNLQGRTLFTF